MNNRRISYLCLAVVVIELLAITVSWIASAVNPFGSFNNPLSSEGVRWMFRNLMSAMMSKWLVAFLLLAVSWGSLKTSGLWNAVLSRKRSEGESFQYRELMGLRASAVITIVFFAIMLLLTLLPEALLLSATGELFPSPFSEAIIPAVSLWITVTSVVYGIIKGTFRSVPEVFGSFFFGISRAAPLIVLLMLSLHCLNVIKMLLK